MPLTATIARFNRSFTNPILMHIAGRVPGLAILEHTGRRSGRGYRIPMIVFRVEDGYQMALTYGPDTDWVKNVLAAGGCRIFTRGQQINLRRPVIRRDPSNSWAPFGVRQILSLTGTTQYIRFQQEHTR